MGCQAATRRDVALLVLGDFHLHLGLKRQVVKLLGGVVHAIDQLGLKPVIDDAKEAKALPDVTPLGSHRLDRARITHPRLAHIDHGQRLARHIAHGAGEFGFGSE